jgi:hypothetical protein
MTGADGIGGTADGFRTDDSAFQAISGESQQMLNESNRGAVLVTNSVGRLLGAFFGVS